MHLINACDAVTVDLSTLALQKPVCSMLRADTRKRASVGATRAGPLHTTPYSMPRRCKHSADPLQNTSASICNDRGKTKRATLVNQLFNDIVSFMRVQDYSSFDGVDCRHPRRELDTSCLICFDGGSDVADGLLLQEAK